MVTFMKFILLTITIDHDEIPTDADVFIHPATETVPDLDVFDDVETYIDVRERDVRRHLVDDRRLPVDELDPFRHDGSREVVVTIRHVGTLVLHRRRLSSLELTVLYNEELSITDDVSTDVVPAIHHIPSHDFTKVWMTVIHQYTLRHLEHLTEGLLHYRDDVRFPARVESFLVGTFTYTVTFIGDVSLTLRGVRTVGANITRDQ